jgi:hypothetical protein
MSHLFAFGNPALDAQEETEELRHLIGELFLFANEFFDYERVIPGVPTDVDLMLVSMPTWDLSNRRDLAYTVTQAYSVLDIAMTSTSPKIVTARLAAFGDAAPVVDGLPVRDFLAMIFGLFASARSTIERFQVPRVIYDRQTLLQAFPAAQATLDTIFTARAKTAAEFRTAFGGNVPSQDEFLALVRERRFMTNHLRILRSNPFLRLDDQHVALLDIQFLAELLSQGVYWTIFDSLDRTHRQRFMELWGEAFEAYVAQLLAYFYPPAAGFLRTNVLYPSGEVDALFDFGDDVILMETKSSLLTEIAKRNGLPDELLSDLRRKYVQTEDGEPKGVVQLANACRAVAEGQIATSLPHPRLYPVLLTQELCLEAPGCNSYLNQEFVDALGGHDISRPLTVMSAGELEEALPYFAAARVTWSGLLDERFPRDGGVLHFSVHQTLYDLLARQQAPRARNDFLLQKFSAIYQEILRMFQGPPPTP